MHLTWTNILFSMNKSNLFKLKKSQLFVIFFVVPKGLNFFAYQYVHDQWWRRKKYMKVSKREKYLRRNILKIIIYFCFSFSVKYDARPAKFADSVDLKDGLLNNGVCIVKFLVVESYFSCNTTHTVSGCTKPSSRTGITKKSEDDCDELIYLYWRVMFKVPESTPKI